jgi:DNA repair exonuclease SbcCD ATPase subunit
MFKKLKELFNYDKVMKEKEEYLKELESKTSNKEEFVSKMINEATEIINKDSDELSSRKRGMEEKVNDLEEQIEKSNRQLTRLNNSIKKVKNESAGIKELIDKFPTTINYKLIEEEIEVLNLSLGEDGVLNIIVELDFHHKDSKTLRKDMNVNSREIKKLLTSYESRYTTKQIKQFII